MYGVSNDYKTAMHQKVQQHKIKGTIGVESFTDANILAGSMTITNQCSGNEEIAVGQVFVGELKATFRNVNIARGSWEGKEITVTFSLLIDEENDTWEDVPVGVYTVTSPEHSASGVSVVAYDHMKLFDKPCDVRFTAATPYDMLAYACTECGATLGLTEQQIQALPNGNVIFTQYPESDIETWRDMVSWIASTLACFAYAGRDGKIYLRQYDQTVVDTIDDHHRHSGATFSDFSTKYTAMSVVNMREGTTSYYAQTVDDGLTYNMGSNPFLQYNMTARETVLNALASINYVPFKSSMIGNLAYDLGDVIRFTDGHAVDSLCCITKFVYTHHRGYSAVGVGKNPATAGAKSKTDKNITGLINNLNTDGYDFEAITNGRTVTVEDTRYRRILRADLLAEENAKVKVDIEVLVEITLTTGATKAIGTIEYALDGTILDRHPIETWFSGKHILHLMHHVSIGIAGFHTFDVYLTMSGGQADIAQYGIEAIFSGIGVVTNPGWNGKIELEEDAPIFEISGTGFNGADYSDDDITIRKLAPVRITVSDIVSEFAIKSITFDNDAVDNLILIKHLEQSVRVTEDGIDRATESGDVRYTEEEE